MDWNGLLIVSIFLLLIAVDRSNALSFRELDSDPTPDSTSNATQDSSSPSPVPNEKKSILTQAEVTKPKDPQMTSPSVADSKSLNNTSDKTGSENSSDKQLNKGKNQDAKEKEENATPSITTEGCRGNQSCSDQSKSMIACIQNSENGSSQLTLLVQNKGDITLRVNLTIVSSTNNSLPAVDIPSHQTKKIDVPSSGEKMTKIVLNAGNGDCELHIDAPKTKSVDDPSKSGGTDDPSKSKGTDDPSKSEGTDNPTKSEGTDDPSKSEGTDDPSKSKGTSNPSESKGRDDPSKSEGTDNPSKSKGADDPSKSKGTDNPSKPEVTQDPTKFTSALSQSNLLKQLSFYSKQVTPIYGAYFAFLVALLIGGTWACCSFRKRRTDGGVPYQELEMGLPESSNAVNVDTAEGWDADWDDDDWDEDKAIRSPGGHAKTVSSNGLTSRATRKEGWDADWDD